MKDRVPLASARLTAAPDVLFTTFEEEVVLLNLKDGVYYGLDTIGAAAWAMLQRPTSLPALRDAIVAEYDVTPRACQADLERLVGELVDRGLVVVVP